MSNRVVIGMGRDRLVSFSNPRSIVTAQTPSDVLPALGEIEAAVAAGKYAAGYIAYEAAAGFDSALVTHPLTSMPLLWFGIFEGSEALDADQEGAVEMGDWLPSVSAVEHARAVAAIKTYMRAGDTYQVNYTFRLRSSFDGDPWELFLLLREAQRAQYCAYIDTGPYAVCSASPELFFELDGDTLVSRPMKGTQRRGMTLAEDNELAVRLRHSEKNNAENVMITDMVRNDMGRVATPGTVHVPELFAVERYPTVFQMISEVTSTTTAPVSDIIQALFPCASITGAPKVRTMEIIRELEPEPRGVYTGMIGVWGPNRQVRFNVAIRTVVVDRDAGKAEFGVGGGIVWDSNPEHEYEECRLKARVLTSRLPEFSLLETLLWEDEGGYFLLEGHVARLERSATYFDYPVEVDELRARLDAHAQGLHGPHRVRVLVTRAGDVAVECVALTEEVPEAWRVGFAAQPVDSKNVFLYHKTTHRTAYEQARAKGYDDVILCNERGEVTEATVANVVVDLNGEKLTPPVSCGLLAGVYREHLLRAGEIREAVLMPADLQQADRLWLINSVRKWIPAYVHPSQPSQQ